MNKRAIGQTSALRSKADDISRPMFIMQSTQRDHTMKQIPCKDLSNRRTVGKKPKLPDSHSQVIKYGYGRHHPKGLASLDIVPIDNSKEILMPKVDTFYAGYDNPLGVVN